MGSTPGSGRSPGEGHGNPFQYPCLENPRGQRSLVNYAMKLFNSFSPLLLQEKTSSPKLQVTQILILTAILCEVQRQKRLTHGLLLAVTEVKINFSVVTPGHALYIALQKDFLIQKDRSMAPVSTLADQFCSRCHRTRPQDPGPVSFGKGWQSEGTWNLNAPRAGQAGERA